MKNFAFASDNTTMVHPSIIENMKAINTGYDVPYCEDQISKDVKQMLEQDLFPGYTAFFAYNGTAANVYGIACFVDSYNSLICSPLAHVHTTEVGALEGQTGAKIELVSRMDSKVDIESIKPILAKKSSKHHSQPKCVLLTQCTENGLSYNYSELLALSEFCKQNEMYLFVDGARIMNSVIFNIGVGKSISEYKKELQRQIVGASVDGFAFGFTKNGGMFGDMVLIKDTNKKAIERAYHLQKQYLQLNSKNRYLAVGIKSLLQNDVYIKNAINANEMALELRLAFSQMGFQMPFQTEGNIVLVEMKRELYEAISQKYAVHDIAPKDDMSLVRFICSFTSTKGDVKELANFVKTLL